jgi:hypothetical protein
MDRDALLRALEGIASGGGSAEALDDSDFFRGLYPVASQARTFELDRIVIVGGRGTGKTQIFRALLSDKGRQAIVKATGVRLVHDVRKMLLVEGFAAGRSFRKNAPNHPAADTIQAALSQGDVRAARKLWLGLSLARLAIEEPALSLLASDLVSQLTDLREMVGSPRKLLNWVDEDVERPFAILDRVDADLSRQGWACVFTFDALDRAANDWGTLEVVVGGLLSLALDIQRRHRSLRLKVFLRPDLEVGGARRFPDASKLRGYREELLWSKEDLYRLVFKRMVGQRDGGPQSYEYLTELLGTDKFTQIDLLGYTPTVALDEEAQARVMTDLVGKYMGANPRKGLTYTWIPNHLADAMGRVSPRSFLVAFAEAARWTGGRSGAEKGVPTLLSPTALGEGVKAASVQRVLELAEDFEWIEEVSNRLEGLEVPCAEEKVLQRLDACVFPPPLPASLRSTESSVVLQQLRDIGVFLRDRDGRYNVPDLYRVAMRMKRRGGIKLAH